MLSERNYMGSEAERVATVKVKAAPPPLVSSSNPPGAEPPAQVLADSDPAPRGLWQFNLQHPTLPGTVSVTVVADEANARGLAYLVAEEFCAQIIGRIKAG